MTDTIETRVGRGVALLDRTLADWDERIDLDKLDLASGCNCILGQTWDGELDVYERGFDLATDRLFPNDPTGIAAADYGFDSYNPRIDPWGPLTSEWKRVILARRTGA